MDSSSRGADSTKGNISMRMLAPGEDTAFIPIDTANKMIGSYLASVQSGSGTDTNLHSLIIDANALREYLTSDSGADISPSQNYVRPQADVYQQRAQGSALWV